MARKHHLSKKQKTSLTFAGFITLIFTLLLLSYLNFHSYFTTQKVLGAQTEAETEELKNLKTEVQYWESFLKTNPTYFDGWIELAKIEIEIGDRKRAQNALGKIKQINPNSEKIKIIEDSISLLP